MRFVLVATLLLAPFALASHSPTAACESDGTPSLGILQINTVPGGSGLHGPNPDGAFYLDDRDPHRGGVMHLYEESNGIYGADSAHNLQRGPSPYWPDDPDICVDDPNVIPDTHIL